MIKVQGLTKKFGRITAVDHIDFEVEKGEIIGFLGPNGAGKTTTMRMLTGRLMPDQGSVEIAGYSMDTHSLEGRRHMGYMPEMVPLYTDMTIRTYLEYVGKLRGVERNILSRQIDKVVDLCQLEDYIDTILSKLSKGYRQRVGLAQSVIHEPDVLILDEPTAGIDPIQVAQTRSLIKRLGKDRTILLSTHILPEVSMVCERVIILQKGKVAATNHIDQLSSLLKGLSRLSLNIQGPADQVCHELAKIPAVESVEFENNNHIISFKPEESPHGEINRVLYQKGWILTAMIPLKMSLEEIFLDLTTEEDRNL